MSGFPRLPSPPKLYDQRDQAELRRALETFLSSVQGIGVGGGSGAGGASSWTTLASKPTTLSGFGLLAEVIALIESLASEPVTNGDPADPQIIFDDEGDVVMS